MFCGKLLKNNQFALTIYNSVFILVNKKRFIKELKIREQLSITDYTHLSSNLPFVPIEQTKDSNYYGYLHIIKMYASTNITDWSIEHGLMFGDYIPYSYSCKTIRKIITFSEIRAKFLRNTLNKQVSPIGPYIHYASPILDDITFKSLKKQFGKTLLFFPSHSSVEEIASNNIKHEIDIISKIQKEGQFQTVLVCMYYLDIQKFDYNTNYERNGFKVVTAGHQLDLNFLRRLKSIIMLSDYTISSSVGTQVGYCIYLKKPHYIIGNHIKKDMPDDYKEILNSFKYFSPAITENQYIIAAKYWGFNSIKSPEQLRQFLI